MGVQKKIQVFLKKFEQDNKINGDARGAPSYRMVVASIPKKQESHHRVRRYISEGSEMESVPIFSDPDIMDTCSIEKCGTMEIFMDFIGISPGAMPWYREESDRKLQEGRGTSCDYYVPCI
jgi:hypothetical protein